VRKYSRSEIDFENPTITIDKTKGKGMKKRLLTAVLLITCACGSVPAQSKEKVEEAGVQFWAKFKAAVMSNDKETVASLTKLPFMIENRELAKPAFIQKFDTIFNARVKRCFAKASLVKEQDGFEVFCGQQIFLFAKVKGVYKFTEIGVND
jgi:hypothetical protein